MLTPVATFVWYAGALSSMLELGLCLVCWALSSILPFLVDERAERWRQDNTWFNDDVEMTSYALGLHTKLVKQGVNPKSDEYYETINARMRKLFPENFEDQLLEEEVEKPKKRSNVVAPATRSTSPKKIRLTTTQVTIAKRLGLTPQQYTEQVAIDMRKQNG